MSSSKTWNSVPAIIAALWVKGQTGNGVAGQLAFRESNSAELRNCEAAAVCGSEERTDKNASETLCNQLGAEQPRETSKLIAITDDDDALQESLRDLMEAAGLVARCFGSAEEFLASGFHHRAACLITDILMPKMSGLEVQARLKDEKCDIPIIFITAYGDAGMRMQAIRGGRDRVP
jgi:CheY-like chemotaxis protein